VCVHTAGEVDGFTMHAVQHQSAKFDAGNL